MTKQIYRTSCGQLLHVLPPGQTAMAIAVVHFSFYTFQSSQTAIDGCLYQPKGSSCFPASRLASLGLIYAKAAGSLSLLAHITRCLASTSTSTSLCLQFLVLVRQFLLTNVQACVIACARRRMADFVIHRHDDNQGKSSL